jgi:hypothetical protein
MQFSRKFHTCGQIKEAIHCDSVGHLIQDYESMDKLSYKMRLQKLSTKGNYSYCHLVTHQTELFTELAVIVGRKKLMSGNCNPCNLPAHLKGTS